MQSMTPFNCMRTTKVYSITMPPDLARKAERLAKKESRTMSELMREALRRYDQAQNSAPPAMAEVLALLRAEAHVKGLGRMSKREVDKAISETRSEMRTERRPLKRTSQ
jgi:predicted transcriptional regulator